MFRLRTAWAAALMAGLLATGCSKKSPADDALVTAIKANLYSDDTTRGSEIGVAVSNGVVTLTGNVPSSTVELQAMKIANGTAGIRSVNDQMKVNGVMAQLPEAGNPSPASSPNTSERSTAPQIATPPQSAPVAAAPSSPAPSAAPETTASAPPPEPVRPAEPETITLPAGDRISVRTIEAIDSHTNETGQSFRATLSSPVVSRGRVIIPAGSPAEIVLSNVKGAGRIKGNSELEVRLVRVNYRGRSYPVDSSVYAAEGKGRGKSTAIKTGVGAAVGGLIGALAGGGKGAAIGSAAGGGAGFGSSLFTHGQQVKIPSESILTFRLEAPLVLNQ
jgi:hypothetical protein